MDIALVGIGKIARDQHIPSIHASSDWQLKATISRNGSVSGIEAFDDFSAFLEDRRDIRVVSLCVPPSVRFSYAEEAILAGRHVMLEKPPGASVAECYRLKTLAKAQGVTLYGTWHSRENDPVDFVCDWLVKRRLKRLAVTWKEDVRFWHPNQDWIWEPGGLGVFDPGINAISIVTKLMPNTLHLKQAKLEIPKNKHNPIAASLDFYHAQDAKVSMVFDWRETDSHTWQIVVETDDGTMILEDGGSKLSINGETVSFDGIVPNGEYPRLYSRMSELISSGSCDADLEPLHHVADAFLLGKREFVAPFYE